jgi:uncharacterized alpha-E superfamily protein
MSRYVERAENITRILTVNFNALLDIPMDETQGWRPIITSTGDEALYLDCFNEFRATNVIEFMLWHPANPNSVTNCITRARENARSVREQISSEMWEHINKLYFFARELNHDAVKRSPQEFFVRVREGSHAFQGITHATLTHGDGYEFIQLGKHLERATTTCRILDAKYSTVNELPEGSPESSLQLIAMLKSCSAFEAFRKSNASSLQTWRVLEYLLLSDVFPRAVRYCVNRSEESVQILTSDPKRMSSGNTPQRVLGRIASDLQYLDIRDVLSQSVHDYLDELLERINLLGDSISRMYFSSQVILVAPRTANAAIRVQEQQQQQ